MPLPIHKGELPYLTREQMLQVEKTLTETFKIDPLQLAETAGAAYADLARLRFLGENALAKPVVVLVGPGVHSTPALVAARHLHNWGANVTIALGGHPKALAPPVARQLEILDALNLTIDEHEILGRLHSPAVILETIVDFLHLGPIKESALASMIHWANAQSSPVLSLEMPSGIDPTTGAVEEHAIDAKATLCLGLPKEGLRARGVKTHAGEIYVADYSVPPRVWMDAPFRFKIAPLFNEKSLLRLR